jgi:curved DNA-binding protein CbpA
MAQVNDPYRTLGVARGATAAEIKRAHRRLAKRYHPDASEGDALRFLIVQEAYRVLADPLLRREWDARHAPGPVRATESPTATTKPARKKEPSKRTVGSPDQADGPRPPGPAARPRSARSYTWSASEVPWWEEGIKRDGRRRQKPVKQAASQPSSEPAEERPVADFEVYNRSSGAAWSMAARAYFRRGDADLPSRGVFRHEGGRPLTAGKARAAAEADTRRNDARRSDRKP